MESSYKRFDNIGYDEGNLVTLPQSKVSNGADPLQFGGNSVPTYFTGSTPNDAPEIILRASNSSHHVPNSAPVKKNNEDCNMQKQQPQRVRLRALETETEYFLRLLNVTLIKRLIWVQMTAVSVILVGQVLLYAIGTYRTWKVIDYTGIGIWAPVFIFSVASGLSLLAVKSPGGCMLGSAMGFQIGSACFASIITMLATISLVTHGRWDYSDEMVYDPEVRGRIICSLMIFGSITTVLTSIFISVQFCRVTCCGRARANEAFLFDVETIKV